MSDYKTDIRDMSEQERARLLEYYNSDRYQARAAELYLEIERLALMTGITLKIPPDTPMTKFSEFLGHANGSYNVSTSRLWGDFAAWQKEVYGDEPA